jgi:hypothetical protein
VTVSLVRILVCHRANAPDQFQAYECATLKGNPGGFEADEADGLTNARHARGHSRQAELRVLVGLRPGGRCGTEQGEQGKITAFFVLSEAVGSPDRNPTSGVDADCPQLAARLGQEATASHLVDHVTGRESYAGRHHDGAPPDVVLVVSDPIQSDNEAVQLRKL